MQLKSLQTSRIRLVNTHINKGIVDVSEKVKMSEIVGKSSGSSDSGCLQLIGVFAFGIFGIILYCIFFGNDAPADDSPKAKATTIIEPEMIVVRSASKGDSSFACVSEDKLDEFLGHLGSKEKTKALAMFDNSECGNLRKDTKFKVLSVGYEQIEIELMPATSGHGLWTLRNQVELVQ